MHLEIPVKQIIEHEYQWILNQCEEKNKNFLNDDLKKLIKFSLEHIKSMERFKIEDDLDMWKMKITNSENNISIENDHLEITCLDIDSFDENGTGDELSSIGLNTIYIYRYDLFLKDKSKIDQLLSEIKRWKNYTTISNRALEHFEYIIKLGSNLSPFGKNPDTEVELTLDGDEIYVGSVEIDFPDYNLSHNEFNPKNPEESIKKGILEINENDFDDEESEIWQDEEFDENFEYADDEIDEEWDDDLDEDEWEPEDEDAEY